MTPIKISWTPAQFAGWLSCLTAFMAYHFSGYTDWSSQKRLFAVLVALAVVFVLENFRRAVPSRTRLENL